MRTGIALCAAGLIISTWLAPAYAQGRPNTTRMSCPVAQQLVKQSGAIVLSTGRTTFDRFVYHQGFCTPQEYTEPAFVRTKSGMCLIGYTCEPIEGVDREPN